MESARQEKNKWKRRATIAENRLRQIRNILEGDGSDVTVVDAVCDVIDAWEDGHPGADDRDFAPVVRCAPGGIVISTKEGDGVIKKP